MADRSRELKRAINKLVDKIAELLRQPLSDESYEVPRARAVRRSQSVAHGRRRATTKGRRATAKSRRAAPAKRRARK